MRREREPPDRDDERRPAPARAVDGGRAAAAGATRDALSRAGVAARDVLAVGVSGHGDGLHLVDADLRPIRPAILAIDGRARDRAERLASGPAGSRLLRLTGQVPTPASMPALLGWLREAEPAAFARIRHVLYCKDWLRLRLTGEVATDPTDAAAAFWDVGARA